MDGGMNASPFSYSKETHCNSFNSANTSQVGYCVPEPVLNTVASMKLLPEQLRVQRVLSLLVIFVE